MRNFKKNIFKSTMEVNTGNCVHLNFFDYKGLSDVTFSFTRCDGSPGIYTYGNLPNTGGNFATWDTSISIVAMPCYLDNTLTVIAGNVNNFVTSPCTPEPIQSFPFYVSVNSSATMTDVCGYVDQITLYTDSIYLLKNSYLYTDSNLSIPFVGDSLYRDVDSSDMNGTAIRIDSTGKILEVSTNSCYVAPPDLPTLHFSASSLNSLNTCSYSTYPITHYGSLGLGNVIYSEPRGIIPIVGLDQYMKSQEDGKIYRVNNSGVITDVRSCAGPFSMTSSVPNNGLGTLDVFYGQPNEIISLSFSVNHFGADGTFSFDSPVNVQILDTIHTSRTGSITLNSSGSATANYELSPAGSDSSCLITITHRSSGLTTGVGQSTTIAN